VGLVHPAFRRLVDPTGQGVQHKYWAGYGTSRTPFQNAILDMGVARRFNHFIGGLRSRLSQFVDPLFYVDGRPAHGYIARDGYIDDDADVGHLSRFNDGD
jgi:hypothetical protein